MLGRRPRLPPLSHHEILAAAAPVTRAGQHVDLAASDRAERRIAFRPIAHPAQDDGFPPLVETLRLDLSGAGRPRLERLFTLDDGPTARLTVLGSTVDELVPRAIAATPAEFFGAVPGAWIAESHEIDLTRGSETRGPEADGPETRGPAPRLVGCEARLPDLTLHLDARTVFGEPMTLRIAPVAGRPRPALPDDVLAILGPAWQPLLSADGRWKSAIKAPRREPRRSALARERFRRAVSHLLATLEGPPADYHPRHRAARWRTFLRRSKPILASVAVVASLPVIDALFLGEGREIHPLFHLLPPALMGATALAWWREMPRFEIPPRPRPLDVPAWTRGDEALAR